MGVQNVKAPVLISRAQSAARAGDMAGAEALYREVLARFPANRRAREGLSKLKTADLPARVETLLALWRAGKVDDAFALSATMPVAHPTIRDVRAAALRRLGRPREAIALYDAALLQDRKNSGLWFNAGAARLEAFRHAAAYEHLKEACRLQPSPAHMLALALCAQERGHHVEARTLAKAMLGREDLTQAQLARTLDVLGTAQLHLGETDAALVTYERARVLAPQDAGILHNIGIAQTALGDWTAARTAYLAALNLAPDRAEVHRSLADVTSYTEDDLHLAQMQQQLATTPAPTAASSLHFGLFKAFDDIGDTARAADHLIKANALRRDLLQYDPNRDAALFETLSQLDIAPYAGASDGSPRPIFIVGLPRSGTTLTEQILCGAPNVSAGGELPYANQAARDAMQQLQDGAAEVNIIADFGAQLRSAYSTHSPEGVFIDKMPLNFRWSELILAAMPDACIVWMERGPAANAFSLYRHCFAGAGNRFAYGPDDIAGMIRHERRLRARICGRWPTRVHVQQLDALTKKPESEIRKLVAFCGLEWSEDCLAPQSRVRAVLTASNAQVRKPIAFSKGDPFDTYAPHLPELVAALKAEGHMS